jgi:hypothetical protein
VKYNVNYQAEAGTSESAQRALWLQVIAQALIDATTKISASSTGQVKRDREAARAWLLNRNADFAGVCALAGVDPDWVRARARKIIDGVAAKPKRFKTENPGVGQNFLEAAGTGPGMDAQDRAELEFS